LTRKPKTFRLEEDKLERLEMLAEKFKLSQADILEYLVSLCHSEGLLENNWQDKIISDHLDVKFQIMEKQHKHNLHLRDTIEASRDKDRNLRKNMFLMKEFLKTRTAQEKKKYFDNEINEIKLLRGENPNALPYRRESDKGFFTVRINNKELQVQELNEDNFPKIQFNQDRLVRCNRGFHTKETWCHACDLIATCLTVRQERIQGMM